jgi:hypothetical protein
VAARSADQDRYLPDPHSTDAVPEYHPLSAEATAGGSFEGPELGARECRMRLIVEGLHAPALRRVGSHAAREQDDSAEPRAFQRVHRRRGRKSPVAQPHAHAQPPP